MSASPAISLNLNSNRKDPYKMKELQGVIEDQVSKFYDDRSILTLRKEALSRPTKIDPASIPKILRRNSSFDQCKLKKNERRVLVIYTGGTIGMVRSSRGGLAPLPNMLEKTVRKFPHLHDEHYATTQYGENRDTETPLVLPEMHGDNFRVTYTIFEYDPLLDSTNMTMDDWIHIAQDIKANYEAFDGFVVLHGTDTMAYTASALSFMMEHLGKSVVITGSQIPLFESRSDGRDNFLGALILAGSYNIPEVTVYFGHRLFRGNRITKVSSDSLNAFDSPNMSPLASVGINIQVDYGNVFRPRDISCFQVHTTLDRNVGLLRLFPSITPETVRVFLQPPTRGVVLQTYGAGNFPTNREDLLRELEDAAKRGIIIVNCTQCGHGSVSAIYETGQMTKNAGVIPGWDMTPEAALTKLSYVLGRDDWDINKKREMIQMNLRGELTKCPKPQRASLNSSAAQGFSTDYSADAVLSDMMGLDVIQKIVRIVATSLGLSTVEEIEGITKILGPSLTCALVAQCSEADVNLNYLDTVFGYSETEISSGDYSGRTPLHFAASLGDVRTVEYLLTKGAPVHVRDRNTSSNTSPISDFCLNLNGFDDAPAQMETDLAEFLRILYNLLSEATWVYLIASFFYGSRGYSPLRDAIEFDRHDVIVILRKCGAHLTVEPTTLGAELCMSASKGDSMRLRSFLLAGANLNQVDPCGRTPLHAAAESGNANVVDFLLRSGVNPNPLNAFGQTPLQIAETLNFEDVTELLRSNCS